MINAAYLKGTMDAIKLLAENGAGVNAKTNSDKTALDLAKKYGKSAELVEWLEKVEEQTE